MRLVRGKYAVGGGTGRLTPTQHQPQSSKQLFCTFHLYLPTKVQEIQALLLCVVFKYLNESMQNRNLLVKIVFISTAKCGVQIMKESKIQVSQNVAVKFFGGLPPKKFFCFL